MSHADAEVAEKFFTILLFADPEGIGSALHGAEDAEKQNPFTCGGWVSSKRYPVLCLLVMGFLSRSFSCRVFFHRRPLSGDGKRYPPPRSLRLERSER